MREETRRKLERMLWRERFKKIGMGAAALVLIGAYFVYEDYDAHVDNVRVPGTVTEVGPLNIKSTKMIEEGLSVRGGAPGRPPRQRDGAEEDRSARRRSCRDHRAPAPHRPHHVHLEVGAGPYFSSSPAISTSSPSTSRTYRRRTATSTTIASG